MSRNILQSSEMEKMEQSNKDGCVLCLCLNVTSGSIRRAVEAGARTFSEVQQYTHCAKSCGMCADGIKAELTRLLAEAKRQQ